MGIMGEVRCERGSEAPEWTVKVEEEEGESGEGGAEGGKWKVEDGGEIVKA